VTPYYKDETAVIYLGDCREVLPSLDVQPDACVADPPYGTTSAAWDRWPPGWVAAVGAALPKNASLWSFGTAATFLKHHGEFAGWKYGQEALWLKRNGSGPGSRDRLLVVHEWAYQWYRGRWTDLHHEWERERSGGMDKSTRHRRLTTAAGHRRSDRETAYVDDGYRQPRSVRVIEAPSVRYQKRHQDEKPVKVVADLVREGTPPGGLVLDPFGGVGTSAVAARMVGRRAVLIEGDEASCEKAAARLSEGVLLFDECDGADR
jgi:site-specific DNA-methyltransferase (adenine-specific)